MNACAVPWKVPCMAGGGGNSCSTFLMAETAAPSEAPGARLKDTVVAGNCPMWLMSVGADTCEVWVMALKGIDSPPPECR